ncbi:MAG TPA: hypothetical protein VGR19_10090 [Allosphingosinicella sp.]|nr:hypothetical protein [Allosphingosinicella sp.]
MTTLRIESRFRGPPASGNGGYVAGLLAEGLGGSDCAVTLRKPPPLNRDLEIRSNGSERTLWHGDELIASAQPATINIELPTAPDFLAAKAASARFTGFNDHIFPECFVCGPGRRDRDGLRIFPGALDQTMVAAPWEPTYDLCDATGVLQSRFIWAALDCPGYFAVQDRSGPAVLGRFTVHVERLPSCDEPLVVCGWQISSDGRKHEAGTSLYADNDLVAFGHAIWIALDSKGAE